MYMSTKHICFIIYKEVSYNRKIKGVACHSFYH